MAGNQSKSNTGGRGGRREGAGRKPGSVTKRTREIAEKAAQEGITPLEYMLQVMRTPPEKTAPAEVQVEGMRLRFEAAKAAAPYMHPRLAAVEHTGPDGGPVQTVTRIELVDMDDDGPDSPAA